MGVGKYTSDGSQYIRRVFGIWTEIIARYYKEDIREKYPSYENKILRYYSLTRKIQVAMNGTQLTNYLL